MAAHTAVARPCAAQVAVKVSRQEPKYHDAGMRELQTLIFLKRKDPGERYQCAAAARPGPPCAPPPGLERTLMRCVTAASARGGGLSWVATCSPSTTSSDHLFWT